MVRLEQMIKITPKNIFRNAKKVYGGLFKKPVWKQDANGVYKHVYIRARDTNGVRFLQYKLYLQKNNKTSKLNDNAWVHCSCPWFTFFCEVALTLKKSSSIKNSNGELPKETNPRLKPWVCKHLIAMSKTAIQSKP